MKKYRKISAQKAMHGMENTRIMKGNLLIAFLRQFYPETEALWNAVKEGGRVVEMEIVITMLKRLEEAILARNVKELLQSASDYPYRIMGPEKKEEK